MIFVVKRFFVLIFIVLNIACEEPNGRSIPNNNARYCGSNSSLEEAILSSACVVDGNILSHGSPEFGPLSRMHIPQVKIEVANTLVGQYQDGFEHTVDLVSFPEQESEEMPGSDLRLILFLGRPNHANGTQQIIKILEYNEMLADQLFLDD